MVNQHERSKAPQGSDEPMNDRRLVLVTLVMLVLSGWSTGIASASATEDEVATQYADSTSENALFQAFSSVIESTHELRRTSGLIHSPYGTFDPIEQPIPLGPENLFDSAALERTRFALVQSTSADLTGISQTLSELGLVLIETIPDDTILIRIPMQFDAATTLSEIGNLDEVRWAGHLPIAWRVSPEVAVLAGRDSITVDLDLTPAPDITQIELQSLQADLASISGELGPRAVCDAYLCQPRAVNALWLPVLAMDGRILHIHEASRITIHNSVASDVSGISQALINSGNTLNGSGEVLAISDTGLDSDHGDFEGRIRGIYHQFGPDNSALDRNSGHGTHVTATLLGDGSGDMSALGMVPAASFHFYQLEVDSSGLLARWGSLYDMFTHSWQNSARIQTNSWGNENLVGQYSSDSRSADSFIVDNPRFLVLFAAGDLGADGSNTVTPPGSAKNVLTIGASTTGAAGSDPAGSVPASSSIGATLDGRIKPDLVAPGVMLCSAQAEEAESAQGESCSSATHDDGSTPLYMTLNGSSMATAVAAGGATMVRQHLRTVEGITEPRSDLLKALLINGAEDLGTNDVPNPSEGWGQIDVANSISPSHDGTALDLFYDDSRELDPAHGFVYTFTVDSTTDLDITLVWVDSEASTISNHTATKLVNDLDLSATAPDGTVYLGNVFSSGYSTTGGVADRLNNVERIKIPAGNSGLWKVTIGHAGGMPQDFSLVATGLLVEENTADLAVFEGSLSTSILAPLQGDTVLVEAAWRNQAGQDSGAYTIEIEDLTEGTILYTSDLSSLAGGATTSLSFPHVFQTTGDHILELRLDTGDSVTEINDETSGLDNNRYQLTVEISQIGVRITPLMEDGSLPETPLELEQAMSRTLDPSTGSIITYEFQLKNEGTSEVTVGLSVTPLQRVDEQGILQAPKDEWWKLLNESAPWDLAAFGEEGDSTIVTLTLEDVDADLMNPSGAEYALPGTFVNDLNLFDKNAPTISHTIRVTSIVERIEGLHTILAGTGDNLGAKPGQTATFSLSIRNTGNGETQYSVSCSSPNQWIIQIGDSQSSSVILDPLSRLQFLPLPIHVRVPPAQGGSPAAGLTEDVSCVTISVQDSSVTATDVATVNVFESLDFTVDLMNEEGLILGALALAEDRAVLNGELSETMVLVSNDGNVPMDFTMTVSSSLNTWAAQLVLDTEESTGELDFSIPAGDTVTITLQMMVPMNAEMDTRNTLTLRTTLIGSEMVTNGTRFIVQEIASLEASDNSQISVSLGQTGTADVWVRNAGNVPLTLTWSIGSLPHGWVGGFQSIIPTSLDMNREALVTVGLDVPGNLPVGLSDGIVPVIVEAVTPGMETVIHTFELEVEIVPSIWVVMTSEKMTVNDISSGSSGAFRILVENLGNSNSGFTFETSSLDYWSFDINPPSDEMIPAGGSIEIVVRATPSSSASLGLASFVLWANSTDDGSSNSITNEEMELEISRARDDSCSGIGCLMVQLGLPQWSLALIFLIVLAGVGVALVRMRRESAAAMSSDEELIPVGSALHSGSNVERREMALETSSAGEVLSKAVSDDEISNVLASSMPTLSLPPVPPGAMPLPPSGLPDGWTMDQWVAYGHIWHEQNK